MKNRFFAGPIAVLLASAGLALGQPAATFGPPIPVPESTSPAASGPDPKAPLPRLTAAPAATTAALAAPVAILPDQAPPVQLAPVPTMPAFMVGTGPASVIRSDAAAPAPPPADAHFWFDVDGMLWFNKSSTAPPLLTTGAPVVNVGPANIVGGKLKSAPGFIGLFTTNGATGGLNAGGTSATLVGGDLGSSLHTGVRLFTGYWLDSAHTVGIEGGYFLAAGGTNFNASSAGLPSLRIPYIDPTGALTAYPIAQQATATTTSVFINTTPGVFVHLDTTTTTDAYQGSVQIRTSDTLQGGEVNGIWCPVASSGLGIKLLAGLRFIELDETLGIASSVASTQDQTTIFEKALGLSTGKIPVITDSSATVNRLDQFNAHNSFFGGQLGAQGEYRLGNFSLFASAKLGLGDELEYVNINGATSSVVTTSATPLKATTLAGIPLNVATGAPNITSVTHTSLPSGLFAQPTNSGTYQRNMLEIVPEANFKLAYRFSDRVTLTLGYTFMYLSNVARPSTLLDPTLSPGLLNATSGAGTPRPAFSFNGSDYWAQGVDFGIVYRY